MKWAALEGAILEIDRPYRLGHTIRHTSGTSIDFDGPGQLTTASNLAMEWLPSGWLYPCAFSRSGTIITNLTAANQESAIQDNIRIIDPRIDMSGYYPISMRAKATAFDNSGTIGEMPATRITLDAGVDGFEWPVPFAGGAQWLNLIVQVISGTGKGQTAYTKAVDWANKRFTILNRTVGVPLWPVPLDATSVVEIGFNDNALGFGAGASNVLIQGGHVRNVPLGLLTAGGKAVNFENGATDCRVEGMLAEKVEGMAYFTQGHAGTNPNDKRRYARRVSFRDCVAEDAGALFGALALDASTDPDGHPDDNLVSFAGMVGKRVGHYPKRIAGDNQKSGAIILGEASNVIARDIVIDNTSYEPGVGGYPGYPTDYADRIGNGIPVLDGGAALSGPVGAVVHGWGRNVDIDNLKAYGNFDNFIKLARARAIGDDASDTDTPGVIQNTYRLNFRNLFHYGELTPDTNPDPSLRKTGFVLTLDANSALRPADSELRVNISGLRVNNDAALLPPHMEDYTGVIFRDVEDWLQKTSVEGPMSAQDLYRAGNTIALAGKYHEVTIADDAVVAVTPRGANGLLRFHLVNSSASGVNGTLKYNLSAVPQCEGVGIGAAVALSTGTVLTAGTANGTDGFFNVAATTGLLQFKNRRGISLTVRYWFE